MMSYDIPETTEESFSAPEGDPRLQHDLQTDLHIGIDASFEFIRKLNALHPMAYSQIRVMLLDGKLI